ncbi:MAG: ribosomal protein S18-alanine N-acetyltransferase [Janthinobacterium lividum]
MSAPEVTLRPLRWWDLDAVHALERDLFGASAWSPESFWGELAQPNRRLVVAEVGQRLVGYGVAMVNGADADVQTIGVAADMQGGGIGRRLLRALRDAVGAAGAKRIVLEVRADNVVAQGLYRSEGFEQIALRRRYYQPGDHDAVIMRARILHDAPGGE